MSALDPSYLRSIRDGILNGNIEANNADALPDGLVGLYDKELFPPTMKWKERSELLHFFLVFALVHKEISADFAAEILGDEWLNKEEKRIQRVTDLIQLNSKRFSSAGGGKYRLYHERFRLYVLQKVSEKDITQFNARFIALCERALQTISEKDIPEKESYALEFISTHFYISAMKGETKCLNKEQAASLKKYAYDQQFWERQIKASKGFEWSKRMLNEMMSWASKFNEDDEVIECALNKVDLYHQEQNDAPRIVQLVADGDIETALERIEKFGGEDKEGLQRKFILYMLCLMELTLLDSKDKEHSKTSIEKILKHFDGNIPEHQPDLINWNDFFPGSLMFKLTMNLVEMELDYLILYKRSLSWDCSVENISEYLSFSEFQIGLLKTYCNILSDVSQKNKLLQIISIQLASNGKTNESLEYANLLPYEDKNSALVKISLALVKFGNLEEAFKIVNRIANNRVRISVLSQISTALYYQGYSEKAISTISEARSICGDMSGDLSIICEELIKQGKLQEAFNLSEKIVNKRIKSKIFHEIFTITNDVSIAIECVSVLQLETLQPKEKSSIISKLVKLNQEDFTWKTLNRISDLYDKSVLLSELFCRIYELGRIEKAKLVIQESIECARSIDDETIKWRAQLLIYVTLNDQGIDEIADSILGDLLECVNKITDYAEKISALNGVSIELIKFGKQIIAENLTKEALKLSSNLNSDFKKNNSLRIISIELAKQGKITQSLDLINKIDKSYRIETLKDIAIELFNMFKYKESFNFIKKTIDSFETSTDESNIFDILNELAILFINHGQIEKSSGYPFNMETAFCFQQAFELINSNKNTKARHNQLRVTNDIKNEARKDLFVFMAIQIAKYGNTEQILVFVRNTRHLDNYSLTKVLLHELNTKNRPLDLSIVIKEILQFKSNFEDSMKDSSLSYIISNSTNELNYTDSVELLRDRIKDESIKFETIINISDRFYNQGKQEKVKRILLKAFEYSKVINDRYLIKDRLFKTISIKLAKQGHPLEAFKCAIDIFESYYVTKGIYRANRIITVKTIVQMITEFIVKDKFVEAQEYIRNIPDDFGYLKQIAFENLSIAFMKQGKLDEALNYVLDINENDKSRILSEMSIELVKQGHNENALKCARSISTNTPKGLLDKCLLIKDISSELAKLSKGNEAESVIQEALACVIGITSELEKCTALYEISIELDKQGKFLQAESKMQEAIECAFEIVDDIDKSCALRDISSVLAKQGKIEDALKCAREIVDDINKSSALRDISSELAKQGRIEEALQCARDIKDKSDKAWELKNISRELAKQGKIDEAVSIMQEAGEFAREISPNYYRNSALRSRSSSLLKLGKIEEAIECIGIISDNTEKSNSLSEISLELTKQGKIEDAHKCARDISYESVKNSTLISISRELAKQGKILDAIQFVHLINDVSIKFDILNYITTELAKDGDLSSAEKLSSEISQINKRQKCWENIAKNSFLKMGLQKSLEIVEQFQTEEPRLFFLKGWVEALVLNDVDKNCVKSALYKLVNDSESTSILLEKFAINQLVNSELPQEKLDRYNRTLNLQWAIDIKNQLPN